MHRMARTKPRCIGGSSIIENPMSTVEKKTMMKSIRFQPGSR